MEKATWSNLQQYGAQRMTADTSTIADLESSAAVYENLAGSAVDGMKTLLDDAGANLERVHAMATMVDDIRSRLQAIQDARAAAVMQALATTVPAQPGARESFGLAWDHFVRGCKALAHRR